MQHIFLAVLLQSLTKQPSKCQICGGGVLGLSDIILIFNLDSRCEMLLSYDLFHIIKPHNGVLELLGE